MTFLSSISLISDFASRTASPLVAAAALLGLAGAPAFAQAIPPQPPAPTTPITGPPATPSPQSIILNPAQTDAGDVVGAQNPGGTANYSVGYFFTITGSGYSTNALAISAQSNVTWTNPYTVYLYEFDQTASPTVYAKLAELTFNPGDPNLIATDDNGDGTIDNYWLELNPVVDLKPNPFGYAIAAVGDFNAPTGNYIESGGTITFDPAVSYLGNGFNVNGFTDYPIPVFEGCNNSSESSPCTVSGTVYGYWNPNLSIVPGPLPVLGGAVAFGWTRRLRLRIRASASNQPTA